MVTGRLPDEGPLQIGSVTLPGGAHIVSGYGTGQRTGSLRAWGAVAADFERWLAEQVSPVVTEARVESETRRGSDGVKVRIMVTARAADLGQAAVIAWDVFRTAAGGDIAAWDTGAATAQIRPAGRA